MLREIKAGDPQPSAARIALVQGIPLVDVNNQATELARRLITDGPLPVKAADDAFHLALATVHGLAYLLTWNCRHLANAELLKPVHKLLLRAGWSPPIICTPYELMGE